MNKDARSKQSNLSIIVSILIAFALWIYVMAEDDPNITRKFNNVGVEIRNSQVLEENGLVLVGDEDFTVDVVVYARASAIYGLKDKINAFIDLSDIDSKGTYELEVQVEGIPDYVDLQEVSPETIYLEVDKITSVEKDVLLNIQGSPADGMTILDQRTSPETVVLEGPEEELKKVHSVVGSINIDGAKGDVVEGVQLIPVDEDNNPIQGLTLSSDKTMVEISIGYTKSVQIEPVIKGEVAEGYKVASIDVEPEKIDIYSKDNALEDISYINTEEIDVDGIKSGLEKEVGIILPDGVNADSGVEKVKITVNVEKMDNKQFVVSKLEMYDKPEDYQLELPDNLSFEVELEGIKSELDKIEEDGILLYVDLSEIKQGENQVSVEMEEISGIVLKSITPETITIQVSIAEE